MNMNIQVWIYHDDHDKGPLTVLRFRLLFWKEKAESCISSSPPLDAAVTSSFRF